MNSHAIAPRAVLDGALGVFTLSGLVLFSVLYVSLAKGRSAPQSVSLEWLAALGVATISLLIWQILYWVLLRKLARLEAASSYRRATVASLPLLAALPGLMAVYASDGSYHYLMFTSVVRSLLIWLPIAVVAVCQLTFLVCSAPLPSCTVSILQRGGSIPTLIFVALTSLYVFTSGGHLYSPDEREMYEVTESIANGHLAASHSADNAEVEGNKRLWSKYGLVPSIIALPPYLVSRALGLNPDPPSAAFPIPNGAYPLVDLTVNPLTTALTCAFLYMLGRRLALSATTALVVALIYGTGTSAWVYSKTFFSQPPATLFLVAATYFAVRGGKERTGDWALSGLLFGLGVGSRAEVLVVGLPVIVYLGLRARSLNRQTIQAFAAFAIALVVCAGITAGWYNYVKTGSLLATGHGQQGTLAGFSDKPYVGIFGSLFSSGFGLVTFNPITILGAVALPVFAIGRRSETRLLAAMVAVAVLFYGSFGDWFGGFTWANRYLSLVLPFAVLPVGILLERPWRSGVGVAAVMGAWALGFAINLLAVLFDFNNGWLDLWDHRASLAQIQWNAHFSPIGAHVRLLRSFMETGAKLDLYLWYRFGVPALAIFLLAFTTPLTLAFRGARAAREMGAESHFERRGDGAAEKVVSA